jgi:hypothetical protein
MARTCGLRTRTRFRKVALALFCAALMLAIGFVQGDSRAADKFQQRRWNRIQSYFETTKDQDLRKQYAICEQAREMEKNKDYNQAIELLTGARKYFADDASYLTVLAWCNAHLCSCYRQAANEKGSLTALKDCQQELTRLTDSLASSDEAQHAREQLAESCRQAARQSQEGHAAEAEKTLRESADTLLEKGWQPGAPVSWKTRAAQLLKRKWLTNQGIVSERMIELTVKRDGTIVHATVYAKDGEAVEDRAVAKAIRQTSPLPCLPLSSGSRTKVKIFLDTQPLEEFVLRTTVMARSPQPQARWCAAIMLQDLESNDLMDSSTGSSSAEGQESSQEAEQAGDENDTTASTSFLGTDAGCDAGINKAITIITSGAATKRLPGIIALMGSRLVRLVVEQRPQGDNAYAAAVLFAKPLSGGRSTPLHQDLVKQAHELADEANQSLAEYKAEKEHSYEWTDASFSSSINVTSIYQDIISLDIYAEPFHPGAAHPQHQSSFGIYAIKGLSLAALAEDAMPDKAKELAWQQLRRLPEDKRTDNEPLEFDEFRIVPYRLGAAAEFLNPSKVHANPSCLFSRVPVTTNLLPDSNKAIEDFKAKHRCFLEWNRLTWLSIAPDLQSVAFCQDGKIYWKGLSGNSVFLHDLDKSGVRGIQWFDLRAVDPKDLAAIRLQ